MDVSVDFALKDFFDHITMLTMQGHRIGASTSPPCRLASCIAGCDVSLVAWLVVTNREYDVFFFFNFFMFPLYEFIYECGSFFSN